MPASRSKRLQKKSAAAERDAKAAPLGKPAQSVPLQSAAADWSPADAERLQRTVGNRAMVRMLGDLQAKRGQPPAVAPLKLQAKMAVGPAEDAYEREAEQNAHAIVQGGAAAAGAQRQPDDENAKRLPVQRSLGAAGGSVEAGVEAAILRQRGGGQPLPAGTLEPMQQAFSADFSGVRLHADGQAAQLNRQLNAQAFTHGQDIFFGAGKYNPGSSGGQHLLAHELTHVVQQNAGLVERAQRFGEFSPKRQLSQPPSLQAIQRQGDPVSPPKDVDRGIHDLSVVAKYGDPAPAGWEVAGTPGQEFYAKTDGSVLSEWSLPIELERDQPYQARLKNAIKELQRKLVMALGGRLSSGIWRRDGIFGASTENAVRRFQKESGLPATGKVNYKTWQALDKVAGARVGRVEYQWEEELTEFNFKLGSRPRFDWKKKDDLLHVAVNIKFTGNGAGQADTVRNDIRARWNIFNIIYVKNKDGSKRRPRNPVIKLEFDPGGKAQPGDPVVSPSAEVNLFKYPHPDYLNRGHLDTQADKDSGRYPNAKSRSDAGNWRVDQHPGDPATGIPANDAASINKAAAHEFGHLIGLEDEYNRRHRDLQRITGEKANVRANPAVKAQLQANVDKLATAIKGAKDLPDFQKMNQWLLDWYNADSSQLPIIARWYRKQKGMPIHQALKEAADRAAKATHARIVGQQEGKMKNYAQNLLEKRARAALRRGVGPGALNVQRLRDIARKEAETLYRTKLERAEKIAKERGEKYSGAAAQYLGFWEEQLTAGYATGGIMGNYAQVGKKGLDPRSGSPALDHEHGLHPRHVRRFAEFVMKYKPGEIWEARHR